MVPMTAGLPKNAFARLSSSASLMPPACILAICFSVLATKCLVFVDREAAALPVTLLNWFLGLGLPMGLSRIAVHDGHTYGVDTRCGETDCRVGGGLKESVGSKVVGHRGKLDCRTGHL